MTRPKKSKKEKPKKNGQDAAAAEKQSAKASRHVEIANAIKQFTKDHGFGPAIRDLSAKFNVSHSAIVIWLREMEKLGLVKRDPRIPRSIRVVENEAA